MSKIYTKTGDKGKTSLFDGTRVLKNHRRLETYGTFDELSSVLGIASTFTKDDKKLILLIQTIQRDLLDLGSHLADPTSPPSKKFIAYLDRRVLFFEKSIDEMTDMLKPLHNFIIFTGNLGASFLQQARAVARRGERQMVALAQDEDIDGSFLRYFNRLSDLLFTMGRFANRREKGKEILWKKFN